MKLHANARLSVNGRGLLVDRIEREGWSLREAAMAAGVSDRTARKWLARFRAEVVYPAAGIDGDPEREIAIAAAQRALRAVPGNAALLLHAEHRDSEEVVAYLERYALSSEAEARQRLRFIADPLWRAYIFTYHAGYDLLGAWLATADEAERRDRFRTLLTEPVTPSWAAERVGKSGSRGVGE